MPLRIAVIVLILAELALSSRPGRPEGLAASPPRQLDAFQAARQVSFPPPMRPNTFIWPVSGPISSFMDAEHPLGIDIGLATMPGVPIRASSGGVVSFAGGRACCGYGLHVIVEHPGGFTTLYAHLSEVLVQEGDAVHQRQAVGISGDTGYSTSEHLHFEVRRDGEPIDPLSVLPARDDESIKVALLLQEQ